MRHNSKRKGKMMWASKAKEPGLTVDGHWSEAVFFIPITGWLITVGEHHKTQTLFAVTHPCFFPSHLGLQYHLSPASCLSLDCEMNSRRILSRRNTGECWVHPLASLYMCIKKNSKFTFKRPPQTTVPSIRQLLQRLWDTGLHAKMKTNYLTHILKRQLGKLYFLYFWRLNIFNFPTSQILFSGILRQSQKKQVSMRDLCYKNTYFLWSDDYNVYIYTWILLKVVLYMYNLIWSWLKTKGEISF